MRKNARYSEVLAQLEAIVERMNRGEVPIDELGPTVKSAADMIRFLKDKLRTTEVEVERILKEIEEDQEAPLPNE